MRSPWLLMKSSTWASYYSNPKKIPRLVFPGCQFDILRWYVLHISSHFPCLRPLFWRFRKKDGQGWLVHHGMGWNPPSPPRSWRRRSEVRPWSFMAYKTPWSLRLLGFWWVPLRNHGFLMFFLGQQTGWLQTFPVLGINNDNCAIWMIMYWPNQLKMS